MNDQSSELIWEPGPSYERYAEIYSDAFLAELGKDFDFDTDDPQTRSRLYEIPYRFQVARRNDDRGHASRETRQEYEKLAKRLSAFLEQLEKFNGHGIDTELWIGAKKLPSFDPHLDAADYPDFIYKSSIAYRYEFHRYLNFLQLGLDHQIKMLKSPGGRPKDEGLNLAVIYIANFWMYDLGRAYRLDYHKGSGLTDTVEFTRRLIQQIEPIEERQIISVMRRIKSEDRHRQRTFVSNSQKPS